MESCLISRNVLIGFTDSAPPVPVPRIRKQLKIPKMPTEHSGINIHTVPRIMPPKRRKKSNTSSELEYIKRSAIETEIEGSHFYSENGLIDKNINADCNKVTMMTSLDTFNLTAECPDRINNYFNFVKPKPYYSNSNTLYNAKTCDTQEDDDSGVYFAEITSLESQKHDQSEVKQNVETDPKSEGTFQTENNYSNNLINSSYKQNSTDTTKQIINTDAPVALLISSQFNDHVKPYCSTNISQDSDNKNLKMNGVTGYLTCSSKANILQNERHVIRENNATSDIEFEEYCTENADCTMKETSDNLTNGNNGSPKASAINSNDISEIVDRFLLLDGQDCPSNIPTVQKENVSQEKCKLSLKEEPTKTKEDPLVEISKKFSMFLSDMLGSSSLLNAVPDEVVKPLSNSHSLLSAVDNKSSYENPKFHKISVNEHFKSQTFLKDKESKCDKYCANDLKQNNFDHVDSNNDFPYHDEEAHVKNDPENSTSIMELTDQSCNEEFYDVLENNMVDIVDKNLETDCSKYTKGDLKVDQSSNSCSSALSESDISYFTSETEMQSELDGGGVAEKDSETNAANSISLTVFTGASYTTEVSVTLENSNSDTSNENLQIECSNYVDDDKESNLSPNFQNYDADNLTTLCQPIETEIESKLNLEKEKERKKDFKENTTNEKIISVFDFTDVVSTIEPSVVLESGNSTAKKELQTDCTNHAECERQHDLPCNFQNSAADNLQESYQPSVTERENKWTQEELDIQKVSEAKNMDLAKNASDNSFRVLSDLPENSNLISEMLETECYNYEKDNTELNLRGNSQISSVSTASLFEGNQPSEIERGIGSVVGNDKLLYGNNKETICELENKNAFVINTKKKSVKFNDTVKIINKVEYALQRNRSISIKEEKTVFKRETWMTTRDMKSHKRESTESDSDDSENMVEDQDLWKSYNEELCEKPKKSCLPSFESFIAKSCGTVAIKTEEEKIHDHELWTSDNNQVNNSRNTRLPSFESFISKTSNNINTNLIQNADKTDSEHRKLTLFESSISECEAHSSLPKVPTPPKCSTPCEILLDATFWTKQKSSDNVTGPPKSEYQ